MDRKFIPAVIISVVCFGFATLYAVDQAETTAAPAEVQVQSLEKDVKAVDPVKVDDAVKVDTKAVDTVQPGQEIKKDVPAEEVNSAGDAVKGDSPKVECVRDDAAVDHSLADVQVESGLNQEVHPPVNVAPATSQDTRASDKDAAPASGDTVVPKDATAPQDELLKGDSSFLADGSMLQEAVETYSAPSEAEVKVEAVPAAPAAIEVEVAPAPVAAPANGNGAAPAVIEKKVEVAAPAPAPAAPAPVAPAAPAPATAEKVAPVEAQPGLSTGTEVSGNVFKEAEKGFSIEFPSTWEVKKGFAGMDVVAISPAEPNETFRENINVASQKLDRPMDLATFYEQGHNALKTQLPAFKLINNGETKVQGVDGRWIEFSQKSDNVEAVIMQYYLLTEGGTHAYIITGAAAPNKIDTFKPVFEKIVQSFKVLEPQASAVK